MSRLPFVCLPVAAARLRLLSRTTLFLLGGRYNHTISVLSHTSTSKNSIHAGALKSAEMAPTKKAKKASDSINSRLALVMKSGKGLFPLSVLLRCA